MRKRIFLAVLVGLFFFGCGSPKSNRISSADIHQSYSVNGSKSFMDATAIFTVGDSSGQNVELSAPAKIEFNGQTMIKMEYGMFAKEAKYYHSLQEYTPRQTFTFTNADGNQESHEITINSLEINGKDWEISLADGGELPLSRPVEIDEDVNLLIDSTILPPPSNEQSDNRIAKPDYARSLPTKLNEARTKIVIEPDSLKNFAAGQARVRVFVNKSKTISNSAKGVSIKSQYVSEAVPINVKN